MIGPVLATALLVAALVGEQPAPPASAPSMSESLVATLRAEASKAYPVKFNGIPDVRNKQMRLMIDSGRTSLARRFSQAEVDGGKLKPRPADLLDAVVVICGDSDAAGTFECESVTLKNAAGAVVKPLSYRAGPNTYSNRMGAKWTVHQVMATFPITGLEAGFTVEYLSVDSVEFSKAITADEAKDQLMLGLPK